MLKLLLLSKKYTCSCCGYKSLSTNDMGEICPICFWEEDYYVQDNLFEVSSANHIALYQAQENFKTFGCCKKEMMKHCRIPKANEKHDPEWRSIQVIVANKYDIPHLDAEIRNLSELLIQNDSPVLYKNFKSLHEILIDYDYDELELNHIEFREEIETEKYKQELHLKSLLKALCNKNAVELWANLFNEYYLKGLRYYISWAIMLSVLTKNNEFVLDQQMTDIFMEIENNDYYGLDSLKNNLIEFWRRGVV